MKHVRTHTGKDKMWADEKGVAIPYNRTTKLERLQERRSAQLLKKAVDVNSKLKALKDLVKEVHDEVYNTFAQENNLNLEERKGNFTWFNFDRSIKVNCKITERIDFDDLHINACKAKLDEFLEENIESKDDFIKQLVLDAFETSRGRLDAKKVMSLLRYRSKIKSPLFQEAMKHLEDSVRRPDSKTYFQISIKNEEGEYDNIDLNFSNI